MAGFTKLFSDIITSTIWREKDHVRIVWITMLAMATKQGVVEASIPGLANMANVSLEECLQALTVLKSPDEYSRTKDNEGRRIADTEGGWEILNYAKYRNRLSADDRREYQRIKQMEYRATKKSQPLPGEPAAIRAAENGDLKAADAITTAALPESTFEVAPTSFAEDSPISEDNPFFDEEGNPALPKAQAEPAIAPPKRGKKPHKTEVSEEAPARIPENVPQRTNYEKQSVPMRKSKSSWSTELPSVPREPHAKLATESPVEQTATAQNEQSMLRQHVPETGQAPKTTLSDMRQSEHAETPSGLQETTESRMVLSASSSSAPQNTENASGLKARDLPMDPASVAFRKQLDEVLAKGSFSPDPNEQSSLPTESEDLAMPEM